MSRLRQVGELKKLEVALAEARSEASKAEESLEELAALRAFLDGLTPAHHFQVACKPRCAYHTDEMLNVVCREVLLSRVV